MKAKLTMLVLSVTFVAFVARHVVEPLLDLLCLAVHGNQIAVQGCLNPFGCFMCPCQEIIT